MNNNKILGILKIDKRGMASQYTGFENAKKDYDPQLIAGFFYAVSNFTGDFLGEGLQQLQTNNYKLIFQKDNEDINVYIVENGFDNYDILKIDSFKEYSYVLNEISVI